MLRHDSRGSGHWIHELRSNDHRHHWHLEGGDGNPYHRPLIISGANPMYALVDQKEREKKGKQMKEARKRGGVKF
jgi:hypothetical protein